MSISFGHDLLHGGGRWFILTRTLIGFGANFATLPKKKLLKFPVYMFSMQGPYMRITSIMEKPKIILNFATSELLFTP